MENKNNEIKVLEVLINGGIISLKMSGFFSNFKVKKVQSMRNLPQEILQDLYATERVKKDVNAKRTTYFKNK